MVLQSFNHVIFRLHLNMSHRVKLKNSPNHIIPPSEWWKNYPVDDNRYLAQ